MASVHRLRYIAELRGTGLRAEDDRTRLVKNHSYLCRPGFPNISQNSLVKYIYIYIYIYIYYMHICSCNIHTRMCIPCVYICIYCVFVYLLICIHPFSLTYTSTLHYATHLRSLWGIRTFEVHAKRSHSPRPTVAHEVGVLSQPNACDMAPKAELAVEAESGEYGVRVDHVTRTGVATWAIARCLHQLLLWCFLPCGFQIEISWWKRRAVLYAPSSYILGFDG